MWYYEIMSFQSVLWNRVSKFDRKKKSKLSFKKIKHDRYQDQYCNLSTTLNWSFVSILRHNLQEPYLKVFLSHGFRLKEPSIRSVCSRGLPFGSLLHSLRTITRFEDMIFLERREDVYMIRSDVSTWMYFVLAQNVVLVTFGTSDKL